MGQAAAALATSFQLSSAHLWLKVEAQVAAGDDDAIGCGGNALKVAHGRLSLHLQGQAGRGKGSRKASGRIHSGRARGGTPWASGGGYSCGRVEGSRKLAAPLAHSPTQPSQ